MAMGSPLKVVYWNVAGIPAGEIDKFLGDLDKELQWDVLMLLEFSAARHEVHFQVFEKRAISLQPNPSHSAGAREHAFSSALGDS